jgi:hypothetical protein
LVVLLLARDMREVVGLTAGENMGVSSFPIVEGQDTLHYLTLPIEWKWLSDCATNETLGIVSKERGLVPLDEFYSYSRQDALENLGKGEVEEYEAEAEVRDDGFYLDGGLLWSHERRWFDPVQALTTTRGLLEYLRQHPEQPDDGDYDANGFIYILQELENILVEAQTNAKRFYITSAG